MKININKNFIALFMFLSVFILSCNDSGNYNSGFNERNETMKLSFKGKNGKKYILVVKGMSDTNEKFEEFGDEGCSKIYKYALFDRAANENENFPSELKMEIKSELFNEGRRFAIDKNPDLMENSFAQPNEVTKAIEKYCKYGKNIVKTSPFLKNLKLGDLGLFKEYLKSKE
jgi:lipoprotein